MNYLTMPGWPKTSPVDIGSPRSTSDTSAAPLIETLGHSAGLPTVLVVAACLGAAVVGLGPIVVMDTPTTPAAIEPHEASAAVIGSTEPLQVMPAALEEAYSAPAGLLLAPGALYETPLRHIVRNQDLAVLYTASDTVVRAITTRPAPTQAVSRSPVSAVSAFLVDAQKKIESGATNAALVQLYRDMDALLSVGNLRLASFALECAVQNRVDATLLIGLLTVTVPWRSALKDSRRMIVAQVREAMTQLGEASEIDATLHGLVD